MSIIDRVFVPDEPHNVLGSDARSPRQHYLSCLDANIYAETLLLMGFREVELPESLLHVHRAMELVLKTEPLGDVSDWLVGIEFSRPTLEKTIDALHVIGASPYAHLIEAVSAYFQAIQYDLGYLDVNTLIEVIEAAEARCISEPILESKYAAFRAKCGDEIERRWYSICWLAVRYLEASAPIQTVPKGDYEGSLNTYFASRPSIVERLKEIEAALGSSVGLSKQCGGKAADFFNSKCSEMKMASAGLGNSGQMRVPPSRYLTATR